MTGLSGANYSLDFTNNGLIDSSQFNGGQISRNFEVDNKDYKLSLNKMRIIKYLLKSIQMNHLVKI